MDIFLLEPCQTFLRIVGGSFTAGSRTEGGPCDQTGPLLGNQIVTSTACGSDLRNPWLREIHCH